MSPKSSHVWETFKLLTVQAVGLVGFVAFVEGVRQMYPPAAFVTGGALAVLWAILKARQS